MNTDELIELIQAVKEAEIKNNEELYTDWEIQARNSNQENKQYENSREGELLQELDETRDTGRRMELIAEIRRERASNLDNLNNRLNAEIERLEGILNGIRNRDIRTEVLNSNDLDPNRIIDTRNPKEKREYENSREGELLQELDETRDVYRRREIIAEILRERESKLIKQRDAEIANIEDLLDSLKNRDFDKILEQFNKEKSNNKNTQNTAQKGTKSSTNPYKNLSNEELQARLEQLENDYNEEYGWRAWHENGMEEHDDDFIKDYEDKKKKIQDELNKRNNKDLEKPRKPEQPMMIKEKENTEPVPPGPVTPEPVPEPEPVPPRGVPEPEPEPNKLPIRSFWEIYNSTATEHSGTIATALYNMAHMKILPHKDEDAATKATNIVPRIVFGPLMKILAIVPNALLGTNAKMDEMRKNIASLSPQEFDALVMHSEDIKEKYDGSEIKAEYDTDYLNSQFMKQYKVNNLYLQAVSERLHADRMREIAECESKMAGFALNSKEYKAEQRKAEKLRDEMKLFDSGSEMKSSKYKNIKGWFLAKFNPDNRTENAEMAKMSEQRRVAAERGDYATVHTISNNMTQYSIDNTSIKGKGKNGIDVGKYSIESPIEMLDRGEDTRTRGVITTAALVAAGIDMVNQVQQVAKVEQQINQHNADITQHNANITQHNADITQHNSDIANLQTTISADQQTLSDYANEVAKHNSDITAVNNANSSISYAGQTKIPGIEAAQEAYARLGLEGHFNSMERNTLDATNWNVNSPLYKQLDAITHTSGKSAATAINSALQQKDYAGALDILYKYQGQYPVNSSVTQTYMVNNPQFDYTAIDLNAPADYTTMHDFLTQGDVTYSGTVAGQMVSQIKDVPQLQIFTKTLDSLKNIGTLKGISGLNINNNINWLPAIFASANALYQGTKQGFRDGIKVAREKIVQQRNGADSNENQINENEEERT